MSTPVTMAQYQVFIDESGHAAPSISASEWAGFGLNHSFDSIQPYQWQQKLLPKGKLQHPVVLVSHNDAISYARWLSKKTGQQWRLPTEVEWEKAARGEKGNYFPWGNTFDAARLNSHDVGAFRTTEVGRYAGGASEYGVLDAAGQVFEWTSNNQGSARAVVKGGSWDDKGCGVCRAAARHTRPVDLKHVLIGFRLVKDY